MNQDAGGVLKKQGKGWGEPRWRECVFGPVGVRLCRGSRMVFILLFYPCVEVENYSLVLRQFWRLTEVPPDLDTDTLSASASESESESGSYLYLKDFLPYLLISLSD